MRTLAGSSRRRFEVRDVHLYALDAGGGALPALARLPHCGAVVSREETARGDRLLTRLIEEVDGGCRSLPADGLGSLEDQRPAAAPTRGCPGSSCSSTAGRACTLPSRTSSTGGRSSGWPARARGRSGRPEGGADRRPHGAHQQGGASFRNRLVLPMPDPIDYALAGIPGAKGQPTYLQAAS